MTCSEGGRGGESHSSREGSGGGSYNTLPFQDCPTTIFEKEQNEVCGGGRGNLLVSLGERKKEEEECTSVVLEPFIRGELGKGWHASLHGGRGIYIKQQQRGYEASPPFRRENSTLSRGKNLQLRPEGKRGERNVLFTFLAERKKPDPTPHGRGKTLVKKKRTVRPSGKRGKRGESLPNPPPYGSGAFLLLIPGREN